MKILVLGNGFDIDHGLATSYRDFLNFCNAVLDLDNVGDKYEKLTDSQRTYIETLKADRKLYERFQQLLDKNHLVNYFNRQAEKNDWIDFERDIMDIVLEFAQREYEIVEKGWNVCQVEQNARIHGVLQDLGLSRIDNGFINLDYLNVIHKSLCKNLNDFALALELYVSTFINATQIDGVAPDIVEYDADHVLTFNYSDTYERIYGGVKWKQSVSYVHGKAEQSKKKITDIILGITTTDSMKNSYVEFEKYYQRITKRTGNEYKKWLDTTEEITVAFFGHSLDSTDSDVIKDFFESEMVKINIFYYSDIAYQGIVANLIKIVGKEKLVDAVYGNNPKVTFIKQREHQSVTTGGIEITRDIRKTYRLYMCDANEVSMFLKKIKSKLQSKDIYYFHSQRKTIGLFEALTSRKIEGFQIEDFVAVCDMLDCELRSEKKVFFKSESWIDFTPWGDEIPCTMATENLISRVNENNIEFFFRNKSENPYMYLTKLTDEDEIKNAIMSIFESESTIDENIWIQMNQIISYIGDNAQWDAALEKILQESQCPLYVYLRIKHLQDMYVEHCFNLFMWRQCECEMIDQED